MRLPKKILSRITTGLKRFQGILTKAKSKDINEADTVTIVADMLSDIFGYDKYSEITSEYAIRNTFVDLAVKKKNTILFLIEVKPIGTDLKDQHLRQVVNYAVKAGVEWAVLTNGIHWLIYKIKYGKPITQERIADINILSLNPRKPSDIDILCILTNEGMNKSMLEDFHARMIATNRFSLSAVLQMDVVLKIIRRELHRIFSDVKIDLEDIRDTLVNEVMKREVIESEEAVKARKQIIKLIKKNLRAKIAVEKQNNE